MNIQSKMLEAFLSQQKFTEKEADEIIAAKTAQQNNNFSKAAELMSRSQNIRDYIDVPTNIPIVDQPKGKSHDKFKNYDHSLEMSRSKKLGLKKSNGTVNVDGEIEYDDGIIMGNLTSKDVLD